MKQFVTDSAIKAAHYCSGCTVGLSTEDTSARVLFFGNEDSPGQKSIIKSIYDALSKTFVLNIA